MVIEALAERDPDHRVRTRTSTFSEKVAGGQGISGNILKGLKQWCFLPPTQLLTEVFTAA